MPEISRFYGIVITIYQNDHGPPHFHARYGSSRAAIQISRPRVIEGHLPRRAERMVIEWATAHRRELEDAWEKAQRHLDPGKIAPLP